MTPSVTGRVLLDISGMTSEEMSRAASMVDSVPPGVTVELRVGGVADWPTVALLKDFGRELRFEIVGPDAESVADWVRRLRGARE
jgi:hypothetical protein